MKKYLNFVIPIIIFVLGYTDVFAQLKVKGSYGKVVIGKDIESPIRGYTWSFSWFYFWKSRFIRRF
ncbi:MAG: hypothetical protein IJ213_01125 [Bacteroidales bacterium]|nr:hypothetical protein [Bacteroidales bacterium]